MRHFSFTPLGYCMLWNAKFIWLNVITDILIAIACCSIPAALLFTSRKNGERFSLGPLVILGSVFIFFCGGGYLMDAISMWRPIYWTKAWWSVGTALSSAITAAVLIRRAHSFGGLRTIAGTRRAQARALKERHNQMQAVLNSVSDGLVLIREEDGVADVVNDAAQRLAEALHMDLALLCAEPEYHGNSARDIVTGDDGRRVERCAKAIHGYGRLYILRDITDSDRAIEALRELAAVVESTDDAVFTKALDGRILSWNRGAEKIYGYSAAEALGRNVSMVVPARRIGELRNILVRAARGEKLSNLETQRVRKDGAEIEIALTVSPIRDTTGAIRAVSVIGRDITLQKQDLRRLEQSLNDKQTLLKEVHHRVKNNLQVISSLLYLQSTYVEEPGAKMKLQESRDRVKAMALVHEKLHDADDLASVNLKDYVERLVAELATAWAVDTDAIRLSVEIDRIELTVEKAITCALILNELISNSLKYAFQNRERGEIRIRGRYLDPGTVKLTIADDGAGLPPGVVFGSTGTLGLELVKSLAGQLDANIETRNDMGAEFELTFAR